MTFPQSGSPDQVAIRAVRDLRVRSIRASEKAVLFAVASRLGRDPWTWATIETISDDAGLAYSTAHAVVSWMRELGVIVAVPLAQAGREGVITLDLDRMQALPAGLARRKITGGSKASGSERRSSGIRIEDTGTRTRSSLRIPEDVSPDPALAYPGSGVGALRDPDTKDPIEGSKKDPEKGSDRALAGAAVGEAPPTLRRPIAEQELPGMPTPSPAGAQRPLQLTPPEPTAKRRAAAKKPPPDAGAKPPKKADRFREYRVAVEHGFREGCGKTIVAPDIRTGQDQIVRTLVAFAKNEAGEQLEGEAVLAWIRDRFAEFSRENQDPEYLYHRFSTWAARRAGASNGTTPQRQAQRSYGAQSFFSDENPPSPPRDGTTG